MLRSRNGCGAGSREGREQRRRLGYRGPGSEVTWVNTPHVELEMSQEGGAEDSEEGGG